MKARGKTVDEIAKKLDVNRKSVFLCLKMTSGFISSPMMKTRNLAIATASPSMLSKPGSGTVLRDYEYRRLGTLFLLAGTDLQTVEVVPLIRESHNSTDYVDFLKILDAKYPKGNKIRLVLDNLQKYTSGANKEYLATVVGRFDFVFTPKQGSWLKMLEGFFGKMTNKMLWGIWVKVKQELTDRIYKYFDEINADLVAFHWKYKLDDIDISEDSHVETLLPVRFRPDVLRTLY